MTRLLTLIFLVLFALPSFAQDQAEEEKSYFLSFIENQLSSPNRRISFTGLEGVLSSEAKVGAITVADREGVWLRIENATLNWSRLALLRGNLSIQNLSAERVDFIRTPLPDSNLPSPESSGFSVPELPLAVHLDALDIARIHFSKEIFGLESDVSAKGKLALADGSLQSEFAINRLDGPGGKFDLKADFTNSTQKLDLNLQAEEPANGIIANLLNIDGRPPMKLDVQGAGVLDDLKIDLGLDADGQRILTGAFTLDRQDQGRAFNAQLNGPIAALVPQQFRDFFGATTKLSALGIIKDEGGMRLDDLALDSAALKLAASAESGKDGFLNRLRVDLTLADAEKGRVLLPVSGGETSVANARLQIAFGDRPTNDWVGRLDVAKLKTANLTSENISFDMGGVAENLDKPDARHITFDVKGNIGGLGSPDADLAQALGEQIELLINGRWTAGQPVDLSRADIIAQGTKLSLKGMIEEGNFNGDIDAAIDSLAPFGALAGRDLAGALHLTAKGKVEPLSGAFDLDLNGRADGMHTGIEAVDKMLAGQTSLTGGLARGPDGFAARNFRLGNDQTELTANGMFGSKDADFNFAASLADMSSLSDQTSGKLSVKGSARGNDGVFAVAMRAAAPEGVLAGQKLSDGAFDFNAVMDGSSNTGTALNGQLSGHAFLNGERVDLSTLVDLVDDEKRLSNLLFKAGGAQVSGNITQTPKGLFEGQLQVDAPDVSTAAALFLLDATGAVKAQINLDHNGESQNAVIDANIKNLKANGNHIDQADIAMKAQDLLGVPVVDGKASARNLKIGDFGIDTLDATANAQGSKTQFNANTKLSIGTVANASGSLEPKDGGFLLSLAQADVKQAQLAAKLAAPAEIAMKDGRISFGDVVINASNGGNSGQVKVKGGLADQFDLAVVVSDLPLALANAVQPALGLGGIVNGTAHITGTSDAPDVRFDLQARGVTAAELKKQGIAALDADAKGTSANNRLTVDARVFGGGGLDVRANGGVPLGKGDLALDVTLTQLPLAVLNGVVKGQDLRGVVTGSGRVTGPLQNPNAKFTLKGTELASSVLRENGLAPLTLNAAGDYAGQAINFTNVTVDGPKGLNVTASGKVPFSGQGLGVNVTGTVPLALANRFIAERGSQASGTLSLTAAVSGGFDRPQLRGMFSTNGAQFIDPETNVRLNNINVMGSLDGETISLRQVSADLGSGGSLSATGTISTNFAASMPANIEIKFNRARYADGTLVVATVNGGLSITGPLLRDPLIAGRIDIERAEISVPESMGGNAASINVNHTHTPLAVLRTLSRAKVETRTGPIPKPTARPSVARLDVLVNAPNKIFVRGRGLDTELGGQVRLTGPVTNIQPVGGFDLIRGRISIMGQRITFDEGQVTLIGDLNPQVNFVARTEGNDIVVLVTVKGTVDDLDISFSSQPELPQDEVLARLLFNRSISELSAFQIAQLAAAAAELAGGKNTSLMGSLRKGIGLDDLDVVTDQQGNTAVRAGTYIRDNIYLGVEAGSAGSTKGTINMDISRHLKAKATVGSDGNSSAGVFYERDY
ncbi:translocation/assembly module TamB domain-containing protein [Brucellaceae bacterium C25G]